MKRNATRLIWIDLETTGTDQVQSNGQIGSQFHHILEVAGIITDSDLNVIGEPIKLVIQRTEEELSKCDETVRKMHTENGLLVECLSSPVTHEEAERLLISWVKENGIKRFNTSNKTGGAQLAGNSIRFDKNFIANQMPGFDEYLHYRTFDVSVLATAAAMWNPELVVKKQYNHRSLEDISESIKEALFYRGCFENTLEGQPGRTIFRAGYERGVELGSVEQMDQAWVDYKSNAQ
ncbi:oligoribonuclease (plasmid) [Photobacterium sp. CCB-ST2H9]|uniref:oligoribonuclease n=1 Tax=Photobacterium sp. CCB-ST2H9 TaxID=2912855 RepID=UPI002003CBFC|nr:oligoribonuclease [Photobacterium sp. CCB-ST2H9]UTM60463.1 oligoribonuclease [Photobacterium sp. CCB-ST2H9]